MSAFKSINSRVKHEYTLNIITLINVYANTNIQCTYIYISLILLLVLLKIRCTVNSLQFQ